MEIKPIKTEKDYKSALKRIDDLFDTVKKGTPEGDEFEILTILVETYENEHYHIGTPDPIEAIKFSMEQMELKPKDLVSILGYKSRVSEILNGKRKLNIDMVRKLHKTLKIPLESLI